MKGIILLNGEPYGGKIEDGDSFVLCVDGGYNWAKGKVRIDENIGDFDSATEPPLPTPKEIFPSQKNLTDGEIALDKMLALFQNGKIASIEIYGGGGGREDHFIGNLHLLYRAAKAGAPCTMITNRARLSVQTGKITLNDIEKKTISLLPFGGDAHILTNKGLFYPTEGLTLSYGTCRGISNVGTSKNAELVCDRGYLLVVENE
jgi:thiamine pyrophosphokinase